MTLQVYRLTLDEDGETDCRDFTRRSDALSAFAKAKARKSVFSARLEYLVKEQGEAVSVRPMEYFSR